MAKGKKILIADDSLFIRTILRSILFPQKCEIIESETGDQTLEMFKKEKPDLILLDIIMPEKNGVKVLKEILEINPQVKIIMVTAVGHDEMVDKCKKIGAVDYIVKPFDAQQINSTVEKYI